MEPNSSGDVDDALSRIAREAADWTASELYRRFADLLKPFGSRGHIETRQDIGYHIEFLAGSLATSEPGYFYDYISWLSGVLGCRGVPVGSLGQSLILLQQFFQEHLPAPASAAVCDVIDVGLSALAESSVARKRLYCNYLPMPMAGVDALTEHLLTGNAAAARALVKRAAGDGADYLQLATRLLQPALYAMGTLWEHNKISVAQEHLATAICQTILAELYLSADFAAPSQRRALFACVEGNQHALGPRMVADGFAFAGWSVEFLGSNLPVRALQAEVHRWRPDLVGLSSAMVQHLPTMRRAVEMLRADFGEQCPIVLVGGLATNQFDRMWRWIGADNWYPDAEKACATGR